HIGPLIHSRPRTGLEGKFSMEYVVATALLDRQVKFANFEDDAVQRPEAQELLRNVRTVGDDRPHPAADGDQYQAVEVHTRDGRVLVQSVNQARGGPDDPLSDEELTSKYQDCAARALTPEAVERSTAL